MASQLQMNTHTLLSTIFVNVRCVCYFVGVIQFARVASMGLSDGIFIASHYV